MRLPASKTRAEANVIHYLFTTVQPARLQYRSECLHPIDQRHISHQCHVYPIFSCWPIVKGLRLFQTIAGIIDVAAELTQITDINIGAEIAKPGIESPPYRADL